jgi:serine protease Do
MAICEAGKIEFTPWQIIRAPDEDLAIVSTSQSGTPFLKLSYEPPNISVEQQVTVVGAALGLDWTFSLALVSRLSTEGSSVAWQISCPVNPGNSGGPVISINGTVIGIIQSKIETAEGIAFGVPSFRMWHYDEFSISMKISQERTNFNCMPADNRRRFF